MNAIDVTIRRAVADDAAALLAISQAAFECHVVPIGRRPSVMDDDHAALIAAGQALAAVDADGSVCGYATFNLAQPEAWLRAVAVAPGRQGRGIGPALIAAVEERARAAGATHLALHTNAKMADNLVLYPRLGFDEVDRRNEDGFERIYFRKTLAPAMAMKAPVDALYGRRKGQGGGTVAADDPLLVDLSVPYSRKALFGTADALCVEVGFGGGEHFIDHARRAPESGLIGIEPFETGLARAMKAARDLPLTNVRFYQGDARRVLEWLPAGSAQRVDVLYPDPWHKQRHWKRRFISSDGLGRLARTVAPGGEVRFASDIDHYVRWTRAHVEAHPAFVLERDSADPWPHWPGTRYETKAFREGRTPRYLTLRRI
ncbi:GNAT family N-acetyltransferase [Acuticoccus sp. MNP-M23]|uniref:GNAT family N-acetyltransferase n=1 Tax=Acuticoccus sp. MNP-M23 TaxID=3072793 RepID=UPI002816606A|nr:GNAT family N-acetyltransferase [Acuticoccus sp. MNP-M23]WMS43375.1 GNAT family N-acetyltransferase [Acuticoccus sp. MNP-M23]